jgi:hypothetical protein
MRWIILAPLAFLVISALLWKIKFYRNIIFPFGLMSMFLFTGISLLVDSRFVRGGSNYIKPGDDWYLTVLTCHKLFGIFVVLCAISMGVFLVINIVSMLKKKPYHDIENK